MLKKEAPECQYCLVRQRSIFSALGEEELRDMNLNKGCSSYKKGQVIFHEGSRPAGLFALNSGKVKISKISEEGKEQIVRLAKEGDIVGYRALLSGELYSSSAVAIDDSSVCFIPKSVLFKMIESNAGLSLQMMKLLSHDLKTAENKITDLAQKPVRERLAEALLFIKETYGLEPDQQTLNVSLTREEIANIVGTATESVIRLLSEFKSDKIIELEGRRIRIINLPRLLKTANVYE